MKIHTDVVKRLRAEKNWSQEKLSEVSAISLRTVQRIETSGNASIESVRALAAALGVNANELIVVDKEDEQRTPFDAIKDGFLKFADFSGTATRYDYWWFLLFVLLVLAVASIIDDRLLEIATLIILLPLIAVGARRLNDTGRSGWWQLFLLVPFGQIVVFILMAEESNSHTSRSAASRLDTA